ncbi:hypothetical protein V8C34DRAFT_58746 [Trichoderma compactum]
MAANVKWQLINVIPLKNADTRQTDSNKECRHSSKQIRHLPIQSQYIIGKQHQLKQHIQPQRHSSQYNPLTINRLHTLLDPHHTLPFQPHQTAPATIQRSNLALLLMQGQHINPKKKKKRRKKPRHIPTRSSLFLSFSHMEKNRQKGGARKQDSETNVAIYGNNKNSTLLPLSHQFLPHHIT